MLLQYQHFRADITSSAVHLFVVYSHSVFQATQEVIERYRGIRWTTGPCFPTQTSWYLEDKVFMSDEVYFRINSNVKRHLSIRGSHTPTGSYWAHTFLKVSMTKQILRADSVSATTALRNR